MPLAVYKAQQLLPFCDAKYDKITKCFRMLIDSKVNSKSFTLEVWTHDDGPTSTESLTTPWLKTGFKIFRVVLHSQELNRFIFAH